MRGQCPSQVRSVEANLREQEFLHDAQSHAQWRHLTVLQRLWTGILNDILQSYHQIPLCNGLSK